jgi:phosphopantetheine--protein transferase-like protein
MKIDIGLDTEEIARFKNIKKNSTFIENNFTSTEKEYCFTKTMPERHLAGIFCVKEAVRKVINKEINFKKINVTHSKEGKPLIRIIGAKTKIKFKVSITHTKELAIAMVIKYES